MIHKVPRSIKNQGLNLDLDQTEVRFGVKTSYSCCINSCQICSILDYFFTFYIYKCTNYCM